MPIDTDRVKEFWEKRAREHADNPGLTNLEEDAELRALKIALEDARMEEYLAPLPAGAAVLDLGGGNGHWAFKLAPRVGSIDVVEYCEPLVDAGRRRAAAEGIANVSFACSRAQDWRGARPYDLVFISGLLLYLNDADLAQLLANLRDGSHAGTAVVLRDGTGIAGRHEIHDRWSEALNAHYSAIYRTREEYVDAFAAAGFALVRDDDMFAAGCVLNKFPETRLRVYRFERRFERSSGGTGNG